MYAFLGKYSEWDNDGERKYTRRRNRGDPSADRSGCVWRAERASERKVRGTDRQGQERREAARALSQLQAAVSAWTWDEIRHWNKTGSLDYGAKSDAKTGGSVSLWIYTCTCTHTCMYVYVYVCVCVYVRVRVRVYGGEKANGKRKKMEKREDAAVIGTWSWSWGALTHPMPWMDWMLGHVKMFAWCYPDRVSWPSCIRACTYICDASSSLLRRPFMYEWDPGLQGNRHCTATVLRTTLV